ncbi:hypothetical protein [Bradyrhizobium sp. LTSP849]|nr:hypothetical protein [Bradyrhizobium sp. LTSP849]
MTSLLQLALDFLDNSLHVGHLEVVYPVAFAGHAGAALTPSL